MLFFLCLMAVWIIWNGLRLPESGGAMKRQARTDGGFYCFYLRAGFQPTFDSVEAT